MFRLPLLLHNATVGERSRQQFRRNRRNGSCMHRRYRSGTSCRSKGKSLSRPLFLPRRDMHGSRRGLKSLSLRILLPRRGKLWADREATVFGRDALLTRIQLLTVVFPMATCSSGKQRFFTNHINVGALKHRRPIHTHLLRLKSNFGVWARKCTTAGCSGHSHDLIPRTGYTAVSREMVPTDSNTRYNQAETSRVTWVSSSLPLHAETRENSKAPLKTGWPTHDSRLLDRSGRGIPAGHQHRMPTDHSVCGNHTPRDVEIEFPRHWPAAWIL
ncbi:hypothetical protein V8C44DRAFT_160141 [Trichoderma aethiopicum]